MEVITVSNSISLDKLRRSFAKDRIALKNLSAIHRFAIAQEARIHGSGASVDAMRDEAIRELRDELGGEHFERVVNRINRMISKEGDTVVSSR